MFVSFGTSWHVAYRPADTLRTACGIFAIEEQGATAETPQGEVCNACRRKATKRWRREHGMEALKLSKAVKEQETQLDLFTSEL